MQEVINKQWWTGFQGGHNYTLEGDILTVYIYDPPDYSFKEVPVVLDIHAKVGHELNHLLAGTFFFKGFDHSGCFVWGVPVGMDSFDDPGRGLFFESWVIHGHVLVDPFCDMDFKLEHLEKGRKFLEETYPMILQKNMPQKWLERWDGLKDQLEAMTEFRRGLTIDPWKPKGFSKIKLGKLDTSLLKRLNLKNID